MIEGGWSFISAAYVISLGGLIVLCAAIVARLLYWRRKARELGGKAP
jgi:hypothetical protein